MPHQHPRHTESVLTLLTLCATIALVTLGLLRGIWLSNAHNGVFAVTAGFTAALLLSSRPGQPLGRLLLVWGLLSAVIFAGRQVGLDSDSATDAWWAWFGVWPVAMVIGLTTWIIIALPEGNFLSPIWRRIAYLGFGLTTALSAVSALWPVEYAENRVRTPFPFSMSGGAIAAELWPAVSIPVYVGMQFVWLPALVTRWLKSDAVVRRQLLAVVAVVAVALVALAVGLVGFGTPTPGLLALAPLPPVLGWFIYRHSFAHVVEIERAGGRLAELSPRLAVPGLGPVEELLPQVAGQRIRRVA